MKASTAEYVASPLTMEETCEFLCSIDVGDIVDLYKRAYGIDVSQEFGNTMRVGFYRCIESGLEFFSPCITGSEKFYAALQRFRWYYEQDKSEFAVAKKLVIPRASVLEVGCGVGHFARVAEQHLSDAGSALGQRGAMPFEYVGLEFSESAATIARSKKLLVLQESIQTFSSENRGQFDVVCAFQVLEHVRDPASFIKACVRCLKVGGRLIVSVPNAESYLALNVNSALNMPPHHVTWWRESVFEWLARRHGLRMEFVQREVLSDLHIHSYTSVMTREILSRILRTKGSRGLIDSTLRGRFLNRISSLIGRLLSLGLGDRRMRPVGHTLTVVLQKVTES